MNNVLSTAPYPKYSTPYLIWWPAQAEESTYHHLATMQPDMLLRIVRACIHCGYKSLYDELLPKVTPDKALRDEARSQKDPHFSSALHSRLTQLGVESPEPDRFWKKTIDIGPPRNSSEILKYLSISDVSTSFDAPYDGYQCDASSIELMACLPEAWMLAADAKDTVLQLDYVTIPGAAMEKSQSC
ncbi:hypothetical protein LTR78_004968 [Recurvomyces mirabilis]|uniref:Uncharacterized protein n=1 Tax=Recurvomyces mirabilis TaxID=574656 RepID=A0AAE0WNU7_9PEZI|nr:hypothetical protein LTR78_004968 [Recurvomyces mirabilis]KAK5158415.1 hypothetical protein LTS14_003434 [Recurvomyces mirabilis]